MTEMADVVDGRDEGTSVVIRDRRQDDLAGCVELMREVHRSDGYPSVWMDDAADWLDLPDRLGAWVAEANGRLVGHMLLTRVHRSDILPGRDALEIRRLFVGPSHRGLGIASSLIRTGTGRAGPRPVLLEVVEGTEAVTVYRRLGWREVARRRADWRNRDGDCPELLWYRAPDP